MPVPDGLPAVSVSTASHAPHRATVPDPALSSPASAASSSRFSPACQVCQLRSADGLPFSHGRPHRRRPCRKCGASDGGERGISGLSWTLSEETRQWSTRL